MANHSKIIVVGASGYIGRQILEQALLIGPAVGTNSSGAGGLIKLELESANTFGYDLIKSTDTVIVCAAISAPDVCAQDWKRAWAVNVTGTCLLISEAMSRGARVVFLSSDTVYGNQVELFDEHQTVNPAGEYAEMKLEVENRFYSSALFKTLRLSYVFSNEDGFTRYLMNCAKRGEEAQLFHPFCRSVVYRDDVVASVIALAKNWGLNTHNVINVGGPQTLSRIDMAQQMKSVYLKNLNYCVTEPQDEFFENRPRIISMNSPYLKSLLGRSPTTFLQAVQIEQQKESNG